MASGCVTQPLTASRRTRWPPIARQPWVGPSIAAVASVVRTGYSSRVCRAQMAPRCVALVADTTGRRNAGRESRSGQSLGRPDPTQCRPGLWRCSQLVVEFCPASKTTVSAAGSPAAGTAAHTVTAATGGRAAAGQGGVAAGEVVDQGGELG